MARIITRFEIYWVNLDPTIGHEIKKVRPAVVVSPDDLNRQLATVLIAPLTSTIRNYPFRPTVNINAVKGQIVLDQIRAIDKARLYSLMGMLSESVQEEVLIVWGELFSA